MLFKITVAGFWGSFETGIVAKNGTGDVTVDQYHRYKVNYLHHLLITINNFTWKTFSCCKDKLSFFMQTQILSFKPGHWKC